MNTAQRIVKNTTSLLVSGIISSLIGLVVIIYLARVLGPGDFGKINFVMAIVIYFTLIANLGLPLLGTREVAKQRDKIKDYLSSILTLRLCLAVLGFGLLLIMTFFLNKPLDIKYLLILYGLGLIPAALLLDWVFQGVERMEYIGAARILAGATFLALVIWFVKNPGQLLLIPCFQVAGNLLAAGVLIFFSVRHFGKPKFRFDLVFWRSLLRQALPIGLALIMTRVFFYIDIVMLGFMKSIEDVGYYSAAYKIIMFLIMAGGAYHDAIFPLMSSYYKTSLDSLTRLLQPTAKLMVTMGLPLAVGGVILAKPLMHLLYGPGYGAGIIALQILIWAVLGNYINSIFAKGLVACGRQIKWTQIMIVVVVVNLILNFILIPPLGIIGAAIATVSAEAIGFPIYYISFSKIVKVDIQSYVPKILVSCVIMASFLYWGLNGLNLNVFTLILAGAAVYFISLYLIRGITKEEIRLARSTVLAKKEGRGNFNAEI